VFAERWKAAIRVGGHARRKSALTRELSPALTLSLGSVSIKRRLTAGLPMVALAWNSMLAATDGHCSCKTGQPKDHDQRRGRVRVNGSAFDRTPGSLGTFNPEPDKEANADVQEDDVPSAADTVERVGAAGSPSSTVATGQHEAGGCRGRCPSARCLSPAKALSGVPLPAWSIRNDPSNAKNQREPGPCGPRGRS